MPHMACFSCTTPITVIPLLFLRCHGNPLDKHHRREGSVELFAVETSHDGALFKFDLVAGFDGDQRTDNPGFLVFQHKCNYRY
jgi:hypothetical protein